MKSYLWQTFLPKICLLQDSCCSFFFSRHVSALSIPRGFHCLIIDFRNCPILTLGYFPSLWEKFLMFIPFFIPSDNILKRQYHFFFFFLFSWFIFCAHSLFPFGSIFLVVCFNVRAENSSGKLLLNLWKYVLFICLFVFLSFQLFCLRRIINSWFVLFLYSTVLLIGLKILIT